MKLYTGIKEPSWQPFSRNQRKIFTDSWRQLLKLREQGKFNYPEYLNPAVITLAEMENRSRVYFTDSRAEASLYANKHGGALVEVEVPIEDVLKYFVPEFKNYTRRRKTFEILYLIKGSDLANHATEWSLHVTKT